MKSIQNLKIKGESAVTLIALIITIVVLMIIAGLSISMLTGDHGIIDEATNAAIQTETAKVHEKWKQYARSQEVKQIKERAYSSPSDTESLIQSTVKNVTSTEQDASGEDVELHLGVIKDFRTLNITSEYGRGFDEVEEGNLGGSMLDNLDDVFVVDFDSDTTYYIKEHRIWSVSGEISIEKVVDTAKEAGGRR